MIIKLIWTALMFIIILGALFFSAIGLDIPVAYYEKSELLVASDSNE